MGVTNLPVLPVLCPLYVAALELELVPHVHHSEGTDGRGVTTLHQLGEGRVSQANTVTRGSGFEKSQISLTRQ